MSLMGYMFLVESVCFNIFEEFIVVGFQLGFICVWDLEVVKIFCIFMGYKVNICSLDFYLYGEFVVFGFQDMNIKFWDIRRKGCVF